MKRFIIAALALGAMLSITSGIALGACGKVTIGEMNWGSAQVIANVEKFILETGYGCEVELIQTATVPCMTSMVEKSEPDIASEIWINSVKEVFEKGVQDGRIISAGNVLADGGVESWWIPKYVADKHPNIKTVADLMANAKLFQDPEDPAKGRFYSCPSGWMCKIINQNLFNAYGMGKAFNHFDPGSAEGLAASIAKAASRQQPWVGYYWAPTPIMGKYPMVQIKLNAYDAEGHVCNSNADCDKPHAGRYPPSEVLAATTKKFAESHPEELAFIKNISVTNDVLSEVLAWGEDNQAEGNEMAGYFMIKYEKIWSAWLPADVAAKVKKALK